ncbi:unnamed protein product, partial [Iphiclides podalirius]
MNLELQYGELSNDEDFVNKCEDLKMNLIEVQKVLDQLLPLKAQYDKMSLPAQIELDLFLLFALNSLHWINLRIQGVDPTTHPIKDELQRIKATMAKWQQVKDRKKRPTLDIEATKRFVRSGLYDPHKETAKPPNKIFKYDN